MSISIIGPPSASVFQARTWADSRGATDQFLTEIIPALWDASVSYFIDPIGVIAQSYKETGGGRFGGQIDARWFNTCGLKVRDQSIDPALAGDKPLAHAMFPSWDVGATAHVQHLRAYVNWPILKQLIVDPRYVWVIGKPQNKGVYRWAHLSTRWAPSRTYGNEIESIMAQMRS